VTTNRPSQRCPFHKLTIRSAFAIAAAFTITAVIASPLNLHAQSAPAASAATNLEYEVASIKLSQATGPARFRVGVQPSADGITCANVTLQILIVMAYGVQNNQIIGAGDFLNSDHYDLDAKMSEATAAELRKLSAEDRTTARQHMMQGVLADRFKLKIHRESRELPVYALVVAKGGSKLKERPAPSADASPTAIASGSSPAGGGASGAPGISVSGGRGGSMTATGTGMPLSVLLHSISTSLDRPIIDKTGLSGYYDFSLSWVREDFPAPPADGGGGASGGAPISMPETSGPNIYTAIQEQLGLKLEATKGPVEVIIVDHFESPSAN